jgi:hypothetical protein
MMNNTASASVIGHMTRPSNLVNDDTCRCRCHRVQTVFELRRDIAKRDGRNDSGQANLIPYCVEFIMRRSNWTPSIVPNDIDETVYLVADDFSRLGRAWREAHYEATDLETVIQDPIDRPI